MQAPSSQLFNRGHQAPHGHRHSTAEDLERENDAIVKALLEDVKALHSAAKTVRTEVKEHHNILDQMHENMMKAKNGVVQTVNKLSKIEGLATVKALWLVFAMIFVVFFFIYLLLKFRR